MGPPPAPTPEPSITEIMKSPSKVVLLRNMVGPGEVDSDLEPEVKDECNTKYGEVVRVIIHELPTAPDDESIRIFVEFKRIESAIKGFIFSHIISAMTTIGTTSHLMTLDQDC
ncbi:splicing factor 45-like [Diaphorina citri]|uniref:Splicing factor 45-like n=1 Tax=Diaphorina citri TaxID=121845 RepID=A0A3Q0JFX3_DIACI|nr:splicing factor 45-like [Diaphorina citri]